MIVALFDLDGTLYTGHIGNGIIRYHRLHRTNRFYLYAFIITHAPIMPVWRMGLASDETLRKLWIRDMAWVVRGWTPQEADKAFSWIAEEYVLPLVRPGILARLRQHQARGHRAILVSGTFTPLLAEIGRRLGVDGTVGTPLHLRNGRYTGACGRPICQGHGKWQGVTAYLDGDDVAWDESYAYADSLSDMPLLEQVGHAVAVYPEPQLAAQARQAGWEIIEDS